MTDAYRWLHRLTPLKWRLLRRMASGMGVGGSMLLLQQGCVIDLIDPDIGLRAFLQVVTEVAVFFLDSAVVALR